jgi:hypothetical protein
MKTQRQPDSVQFIDVAREGPTLKNLPVIWGDAFGAGFQRVPHVLFKQQSALGLNAIDLVVLLNLTLHYWFEGRRPFVRPVTIAQRMDIGIRTVQRAVRKLEKRGLIKRKSRANAPGTEFDISGLLDRLSELALRDPWFRRERVDAGLRTTEA